jgi:hypothetical protein
LKVELSFLRLGLAMKAAAERSIFSKSTGGGCYLSYFFLFTDFGLLIGFVRGALGITGSGFLIG